MVELTAESSSRTGDSLLHRSPNRFTNAALSTELNKTRSIRRGKVFWWLAFGVVLVIAAVLRLWGAKTGLPFVYNPDENTHFVTRAIAMFDHSFHPHYFMNPPGFTYALYFVFALVFGGSGVQEMFALNPGEVFLVARITVALFGVAAVALLVWAGTHFFDRRVGLLAGLLLAVSYLAVFYSHFALNDVPTLVPVCLALVGAAGVLRTGRLRYSVLAGIGIGLAVDMKYTAGVVGWCWLAATLLFQTSGKRNKAARVATANTVSWVNRLQHIVVGGIVTVFAFVAANPYALLDSTSFQEGLQTQADIIAGEHKLGLAQTTGLFYYLKSLTWGFGWIPALAAFGSAIALMFRDRRRAFILIGAPVILLAVIGTQDRFFARWALPMYPILCILAAWGAIQLVEWITKRRLAALKPYLIGIAVLLLVAQGSIASIRNDQVLTRADTRQLAHNWMMQNVPKGSRVVLEPIVPDLWATNPTVRTQEGGGYHWKKWLTSYNNNGLTNKFGIHHGNFQYSLRPDLIDKYQEKGYCWVVTGSTQYGRTQAQPELVPQAVAYYKKLKQQSKVVYQGSPYKKGAQPVPFSFDFSFNHYPSAYSRPGPAVIIHKLDTAGKCKSR